MKKIIRIKIIIILIIVSSLQFLISKEIQASVWPSEPIGFQQLNDQSWNSLTGSGWNWLRRAASKDPDIVSDTLAPFSPTNILRIIFTTGMSRDSEPDVLWKGLANVKEIYTGWWMKVSPNWQCSPAGCGKITFLFTNSSGQVYTNLYNSPTGGAPYVVGSNTEWAPYGQQIRMPNVSTTGINPNEWHRIEFYYKWNSNPGVSSDGVIRWWVDGVLNGNYTNVIYPNDSFIEFQYAPTLQNPPTAEQYMYVDHTYLGIPGTTSVLIGDLNSDKIVNSIDWSIMSDKWFTSDPSSDLNHDGIVNSIDFSILNKNWFKTIP